MRFVFLLQLLLAALVGAPDHSFPYIVYKTALRDVFALANYGKFMYSVRSYSKKNQSVAKIFEENVLKKHPYKVIFEFEDKQWKTWEIDHFGNQVANAFLSANLRKGDTVALMMHNRPEFVAIWLGLSKIGVVTALINTNLRQESLAHCIKDANSSVLIFEVDFLEAVRESRNRLGDNLKLYYWTHTTKEHLPDIDAEWATPLAWAATTHPTEIAKEERKDGYNDPLVYIYTSGTTGLPKAAVVSNARYIFLAGGIRRQLGFKKQDRFYASLPLYHTAGGAMAIGQAVLYGSTVVIAKKFSARAYFPDIVKYGCTIAQYIGEMCRYLLGTDPSTADTSHKLRLMFGNGLRSEVWKEFVQRFKIPRIGEFYGATEGNANVINTEGKVGSMGFLSQIAPSVYPVSVIKVNLETGEPIRDANGLCIRCKPGERGVIIGKIDQSNPTRAYRGYANKKESDKKVINDVFKKGDSAFISGDLVVSDEFGNLFFKDRLGDTFRWKGQNVSTYEVESVISDILKLEVVVVYGVEIKGCEGRAGMAAILNKPLDNDKESSDENEDVRGKRKEVKYDDDEDGRGKQKVVEDDDDEDSNEAVTEEHTFVEDDDEYRPLLNALAQNLPPKLPAYAVPLFIRFLKQIDMTGTYKVKKGDLQKDGFNVEKVLTDKIFYWKAEGSEGTYKRLTKEIYRDIEEGRLRM